MGKLSATTDRTAQLLAACVGAVFFLSGLAYLCLGHWPVTHQDFWRIYDVCLNHTWFESALLKHNGHSLFFPSFIWLADLRFFHGNQDVVFYVGLALLFIATGLLLVPVWFDKTVAVTAKTMATLVIIVGTFWMGRAHITASGGFTCNVSLMMMGAELSFILLPSMHNHSVRFWAATLAIIAGGFLASFSFSVGLAAWPVLLFLAWCLRLPWRCFALIIVAAVTAAIVFLLLPPSASTPAGLRALGLSFSASAIGFSYLCQLLSAPVFYAVSAWSGTSSPTAPVQPSAFALIFGMVAFVVAVGEIVYSLIRRDLATSSLRLIGIALVSLNLLAIGLIVIGRFEHLRALPFEVAAPRYFFHSTLFLDWSAIAGYSTCWIEAVDTLAGLHSGSRCLSFSFSSHYKAALHRRQAAQLAQAGATSLINGVRDDQKIRILAPAAGIHWVYRVSEQLRARRLDMFAEGLQDWIGVSESQLFDGRHKPKRLRGQCRINGTVPSDDGKPAARVAGMAWIDGNTVSKTLVIVDAAGVICGVARSSAIAPFTGPDLLLEQICEKQGFLGYIRDYEPQKQYAVRSADGGALSDEKIVVRPLTGPPG